MRATCCILQTSAVRNSGPHFLQQKGSGIKSPGSRKGGCQLIKIFASVASASRDVVELVHLICSRGLWEVWNSASAANLPAKIMFGYFLRPQKFTFHPSGIQSHGRVPRECPHRHTSRQACASSAALLGLGVDTLQAATKESRTCTSVAYTGLKREQGVLPPAHPNS